MATVVSGGTLSPAEIARIAYQAGWRGQDLQIAVAVALAESGGRPGINNLTNGRPLNSNGSVDYGLFQINSIHNPDLNRIYDPFYNAQMGYSIWKDAGGSWTPWSAYKNGSYRRYMDAARAGVEQFLQGAYSGSSPMGMYQGQALPWDPYTRDVLAGRIARAEVIGLSNAARLRSKRSFRERLETLRARTPDRSQQDEELQLVQAADAEEEDIDRVLLDRVNKAITQLTREQEQVVPEIHELSEGIRFDLLESQLPRPSTFAWGGYQNGRIPQSALRQLQHAPAHWLHPGAAMAFDMMYEAALRDGVTITLTSSYRTYDQQVALKARKGRLAATPGRSNHGWGLAIDVASKEARRWIQQNGWRFGWYWPEWARPGGSGPTEDWHFEWYAISFWNDGMMGMAA